MLFMVIERFRDNDMVPVYERLGDARCPRARLSTVGARPSGSSRVLRAPPLPPKGGRDLEARRAADPPRGKVARTARSDEGARSAYFVSGQPLFAAVG